MIMKRTVLLLVCIVVSILINAQSVLCLYKGGYFIRNGNTWYEYRPQSKDAVWNQYTQYSTDDNYYYVKNSVCKISIPKKPNNSIWINKGSDWKVLYTTIHVYNYCPQRSSHLFCFEDGFFIKKGNKWDLYMPLKSATEVWNSYTEYKKDKDYYYIKNSKDDIAIPRSPNNSFYLMKSGDWKKWKSSLALYDAQSKNAGSGLEYAATTTSSSGSGTTSRRNNQQNSSYKSSNAQVSSLTYKTWETKWDKGRTEFVRSADGMVEETMYMNCVCLNGICKICAGLGVTGYGMFQTYCSYCGGTAKCHFCGGTGTKVTTQRYRYIDEYYSNGGSALHVTSSSLGASVYLGGVGSLYGGYGNSRPIRDEGNYYSFGGETLYGVKTNFYRLSKDYRTLWSDNQEYHIIDKAEYDRISEITSKLKNGTYTVPNTGTSGTYSTGRSSSNSRSKSSSVYIKCSTCGGSTICTGCNGKKGSWQNTGYYTGSGSQSWINCGSCGGTGKCRICYGTGRL